MEVRKTGWKKKTDKEEQEMCEMEEGDGQSRVENKWSRGGQTDKWQRQDSAWVLRRKRTKLGIAETVRKSLVGRMGGRLARKQPSFKED